MRDEFYSVSLSSAGLELLTELRDRDPELSSLLDPLHSAPSTTVIRVTEAQAERVRDRLTEILAQEGLAVDYSPNDKGRILEELIDSFYIP